MSGTGLTSGYPLDFTDGDTLKRFTVTDPAVAAGSAILVSIRRQETADVNDPGWIYVPNVMQVRAGSFDVLVAALSGDAIAAPGEFPNELASLVYLVQ